MRDTAAPSREALLNAGLMAGLLAVPLWAWMVEEPYTITLATRAVIFAMAGVGLNVALGLGGLVSFGLTLAFGQMFYYFAISWPAYGGEDGLSIYVRNDFPGLNTMDPIQYFALCYALLLVVLVGVHRLAHSSFGLMLRAARQNEARVQAVGQMPYRLYLTAFTISGAITGLAGALFADLNRFVSPAMLNWQTSGEIIIFVILGGVGRVCGPVAGAALFIVLEHVLGGLSAYWHIYLGAILLGVVLFARGGLFGLLAGREVAHD